MSENVQVAIGENASLEIDQKYPTSWVVVDFKSIHVNFHLARSLPDLIDKLIINRDETEEESTTEKLWSIQAQWQCDS